MTFVVGRQGHAALVGRAYGRQVAVEPRCFPHVVGTQSAWYDAHAFKVATERRSAAELVGRASGGHRDAAKAGAVHRQTIRPVGNFARLWQATSFSGRTHTARLNRAVRSSVDAHVLAGIKVLATELALRTNLRVIEGAGSAIHIPAQVHPASTQSSIIVSEVPQA
jgi:hypothetical protein